MSDELDKQELFEIYKTHIKWSNHHPYTFAICMRSWLRYLDANELSLANPTSKALVVGYVQRLHEEERQ